MSFDPEADASEDDGTSGARADEPANGPADEPANGPADETTNGPESGSTAAERDESTTPESRHVDPTSADRATLADFGPSLSTDGLALPGAIVSAGALVLSGGLLGLGAAAVVLAFWALASPFYAAAAAAVLFVALENAAPVLATDPIPLEALAAAGVGWLVFAPVLRYSRSIGVVVATVAGAAVTGAAVASALRVGTVPVAAGALVLAVVLALYAIHRYSVVRLAYGDLQ